jgi:BASS family bile acid:Na+ symporter
MLKLFDLFTRLLPVWTILLGIVGYIWPGTLTPLKPHLDWLFGLTMLGIGLVLNFSDFGDLLKKPHLILMGTLAQFTIMPLTGFLIARSLGLPPQIVLGFVLVGAVPGAMASNVISYLARADVAYSISITTTATILAPALTPGLTYLIASTFIKIPVLGMILSIIKMVILPLLAGFVLQKFLKKYTDRVKSFFPAFSSLFIALICGLVVALNRNYLAGFSLIIFAGVFVMNLVGMTGGYAAGTLYRFPIQRRRTLCFEVGMQNAGLGAVLAIKHFSDEAALPAALFATWCVITASILAEYWAHRK